MSFEDEENKESTAVICAHALVQWSMIRMIGPILFYLASGWVSRALLTSENGVFLLKFFFKSTNQITLPGFCDNPSFTNQTKAACEQLQFFFKTNPSALPGFFDIACNSLSFTYETQGACEQRMSTPVYVGAESWSAFFIILFIFSYYRDKSGPRFRFTHRVTTGAETVASCIKESMFQAFVGSLWSGKNTFEQTLAVTVANFVSGCFLGAILLVLFLMGAAVRVICCRKNEVSVPPPRIEQLDDQNVIYVNELTQPIPPLRRSQRTTPRIDQSEDQHDPYGDEDAESTHRI